MFTVHRVYNKDVSHQTVKLIDGTRKKVKSNSLVGFCHSNLHKGHLTEAFMKSHQCLERKCNRFEKFPDYPYWIEKQKKKELKAENKEKKDKRIRHELLLEEKLNSMKNRAQNLVYEHKYSAIITKIRLSGDKPKEYIINYISDEFVNLNVIARRMAYEYGGYFILKRVKNVDGSYATTDDWLNAKR